MSSIDTSLDTEDEDDPDDFHNDSVPNIWTLDDSKKDPEPEPEVNRHASIVSNMDDDELEKPSFLRRIKDRRKSKSENTDDKE
jgi:hypothetical protein